jgi:hypothetical protein
MGGSGVEKGGVVAIDFNRGLPGWAEPPGEQPPLASQMPNTLAGWLVIWRMVHGLLIRSSVRKDQSEIGAAITVPHPD